jgi:hypothetical protein
MLADSDTSGALVGFRTIKPWAKPFATHACLLGRRAVVLMILDDLPYLSRGRITLKARPMFLPSVISACMLFIFGQSRATPPLSSRLVYRKFVLDLARDPVAPTTINLMSQQLKKLLPKFLTMASGAA